MRAGAMGFSTSRATTHVTPDGTPVASRIADWQEIDALVGAMAELDAGIFQIGPDISGGEAQRVFLERLRQGRARQRPADHVRHARDQAGQATRTRGTTRRARWTRPSARGGRMCGQATTRSINAIFSLKSYLPFDVLPAWQELRALPLAEQKRAAARPRGARAA